MYVYIYIYLFTNIHTCMYIHIYIYIHTCICIYTYMYISTYIHVRIYINMRVHIHIYIYITYITSLHKMSVISPWISRASQEAGPGACQQRQYPQHWKQSSPRGTRRNQRGSNAFFRSIIKGLEYITMII